MMSSAVVVIGPEGKVAEWVRSELERLLLCNLMQPFYWIDDQEATKENPTAVRFDDEVAEAPLDLHLSKHPHDALRFVRLVLPGCSSTDVKSLYFRWLKLRDRSCEFLNVIVPTEDTRASESGAGATEANGPTVSCKDVEQGWQNVVVSPEDGSPAGTMTVEADARFVGHAAAAIASVAGLWRVQNGESPVRPHPEGRDSVVLVRSSSRSLLVDRVADRAVGRAFQGVTRAGQLVIRDGLPVETADPRSAQAWGRRAAEDWIVDDHAFLFLDPTPPPKHRPEYVGWRGTLRLLWDFLRKDLPEELREEARIRADQSLEWIENFVQRTVFGDDSRYHFMLGAPSTEATTQSNLHATTSAHSEEADTERSVVGTMCSVEENFVTWIESFDTSLGSVPAAKEWREFRAIVFGLLDGGELPNSVEKNLPPNRRIVGDPVNVLGPRLSSDVLDPDVRGLLPPTDHLLSPGDVAGLRDVRELIEKLLRHIRGDETGSTESDEEPTQDERTVRRERGFRIVGATLAAGLAAWVWFASPSTGTARYIATAVLAAIGALLLVKALVRQRQPEKGGQPGVEAPQARPTDVNLSVVPADPAERERLRHRLEQQLEDLDELQAQLENSFAGRVAARLVLELQKATSRTSQLYEAIRQEPVASDESAKKKIRRRWRLLRRPLTAVLLLAAIVVLVFTLPLAGMALAACAFFMLLAWILGVARQIARWIRRKLLESNRLPPGESGRSFACRAIYSAISEVVRLHRSYGTLIEWCGILFPLLDDPFGLPARAPQREANIALPELNSHQIATGLVDESRMRRLVAGLREDIYFSPGWVSRAYCDQAGAAIRQFCLENRIEDEARTDPDYDTTTPGSEHRSSHSPRRSVGAWLRDPARRFEYRKHLMLQGFDWMAREKPDELVGSVRGLSQVPRPDSTPAADFLLETFGSLDRPFLSTQMDDYTDPPRADELAAWMPRSLMERSESFSEQDLARLQGGQMREASVGPDALLFQTLLVEQASLQEDKLAILARGEARTPPLEQMEPPEFRRQDPVPRYDDEVLEQLRKRDIQPIDDFPVGSVIEGPKDVLEPPEQGEYEFMMVVDGEPLRWAIEEPIGFVVRRSGGPENGLELVRECLTRVARAGGLSFVYRGLTEHFPGYSDASAVEAPLWIGWVYPDEDDSGAIQSGEAAGLGGPRSVTPWDGPARLTGGVATVKAELEYEDGFGPRSVGNVLLHELGHAMNLDHVSSPHEIMSTGDVSADIDDLGPGDRRGLWVLGVGRL